MEINRQGPVPLYIQIERYLREAINKGLLKEGEQVPSEQELAGRFQVNRLTARRALTELVKEGLLARVHGKGTFVQRAEVREGKNPGAAVVSASEHTVALVAPFLYDYYQMDALAGIERVLRAANYSLSIYNSHNDLQEETKLIRELQEQGVEGIILFPSEHQRGGEFFRELAEQGFPLVLFDRYFSDCPLDYVVSDNENGAYQAVTHLIDLGHSRIGHIYSRANMCTAVRDRIIGYCRALRDRGLPVAKEMLLGDLEDLELVYRENRQQAYWQKIAAFLQDLDLTAVFVMNDMQAVEVLRAARRLKLRVPEDLAIVGFDDMPYALTAEVPLTTVRQRREELGEMAARVLLGKIEGTDKGIHHVKVPTELVIRESCGASRRRGKGLVEGVRTG